MFKKTVLAVFIFITLVLPLGIVNFAYADNPCATDTTSILCVGIENPIQGKTEVKDIIASVLKIVVEIAIPIVVLMVIYSGFMYVMARGNAEAVEKAHKTLTWTLVGAAILLGAQLIANVLVDTVSNITNDSGVKDVKTTSSSSSSGSNSNTGSNSSSTTASGTGSTTAAGSSNSSTSTSGTTTGGGTNTGTQGGASGSKTGSSSNTGGTGSNTSAKDPITAISFIRGEDFFGNGDLNINLMLTINKSFTPDNGYLNLNCDGKTKISTNILEYETNKEIAPVTGTSLYNTPDIAWPSKGDKYSCVLDYKIDGTEYKHSFDFTY